MKAAAERIALLRREMAARAIDLYVIPTADFHESEYVGEYFKARQFMTGFTGSAGIAVVTMTEAGLWTDGRYFVQAEAQLKGSTVTLYKMGEEGVPTLDQFIQQKLPVGGCLGFDGRVVNGAWGQRLEMIAEQKQASLKVEEDLVDLIWEDRPQMSCQPAWILEECYSGKHMQEKLAAIREKMEERGATLHLVSALYDIAWILNIRGNDISFVPVVLSYLAIGREHCIWFVQKEAVSEQVAAYMQTNGVELRPYEEYYDYLAAIPADTILWLDQQVMNYRACCTIPEQVSIINARIPSELMKSMKNKTELANELRAHEKDAVAMIRFMYWLKQNVGKIPMTEITAADHLASLRAEQEGFVSLSFATIAGYQDHGAIVHYKAQPGSEYELRPEGLLLVDSGGHYLEGTTDITRTFALGPVSDRMKADFTRVARSNLNLAAARFRYGCTGQHLDVLAKEPLWEAEMDFNHGTGHGVGYLLNVHEGPQSIRWKTANGKSTAVLEEGMITTDEPGLYLVGEYGIRTENELICRKGGKNAFGQFMYFENITYVPIDLDAIDPSAMSDTERARLNEYHAYVYEKMAPYFEGDEILPWLKEYTRAI